jgi:hypothetical protein
MHHYQQLASPSSKKGTSKQYYHFINLFGDHTEEAR